MSRQITQGASLDCRLVDCWSQGMSIRQTAKSVKTTFGADMSFDEVRLVFVKLADRFRGGAE